MTKAEEVARKLMVRVEGSQVQLLRLAGYGEDGEGYELRIKAVRPASDLEVSMWNLLTKGRVDV